MPKSMSLDKTFFFDFNNRNDIQLSLMKQKTLLSIIKM